MNTQLNYKIILLFALLLTSLGIQAQPDCMNDVVPPIAYCSANMDMRLGADNTGTLTADIINNGSYDDCTQEVGLAIDKSHFTAADVGENIITLTVTDEAGNSATCITVVTISINCDGEDNTPMTISPWPSNITIESSNGSWEAVTSPNALAAHNTYDAVADTGDVYDRPILNYDCEIPGVNYSDIIFFNSSDLVKITRTWKVVNWSEEPAVIYSEVQIIDVNLNCNGDDDTPMVINPWPSDITIESTLDLWDNAINPNSLAVYNTYDVTTDTGDVYDRPVVHYDCEIPGIGYSDNIFFVSPDFLEVHRTWEVVNWSEESTVIHSAVQIIYVNNIDNNCNDALSLPIALCNFGIQVLLNPAGNATLTADIIDGGSWDPCSEVALFIDKTNFTTADIGINTVKLTVYDGAGNSSYCLSEVNVIGTITGALRVCITDPCQEDVDNVEVTDRILTNETGCVLINRNNPLVLNKRAAMDDGVNTLDAVILMEHILGIRNLSPDALLAADVSEDGSITALDVVTIMQIVLGSYNGDCPSWKFFNSSDPISFSGSQMNVLGVKMGDVSAYSNCDDGGNSVIKTPFEVTAEDNILNTGEIINIPFMTIIENSYLGMDMTIEYDESRVEVLGLKNSVIEAPVNLIINEGLIRIVAAGDVRPEIALNSLDVLFELEVRSLVNSTLKNELNIENNEVQSDISWTTSTATPYYVDFGWDLEIVGNKEVLDNKDALYTVFPNPVQNDWTVQSTDLGTFEFTLFDVQGKVMTNKTSRGTTSFDRGAIPSGVYFYEIINESGDLQTGKMIIAE